MIRKSGLVAPITAIAAFRCASENGNLCIATGMGGNVDIFKQEDVMTQKKRSVPVFLSNSIHGIHASTEFTDIVLIIYGGKCVRFLDSNF